GFSVASERYLRRCRVLRQRYRAAIFFKDGRVCRTVTVDSARLRGLPVSRFLMRPMITRPPFRKPEGRPSALVRRPAKAFGPSAYRRAWGFRLSAAVELLLTGPADFHTTRTRRSSMVSGVLKRPTLVLNRNWQPIGVASVSRSLVMVWNDTARVVDPTDYALYTWDDWSRLKPADGEPVIRTVRF